MQDQDNFAAANEQWWEKMVKEKCGFTQPWLNIDKDLIQKFAEGKLDPATEMFIEMFPISIFRDVEGKDVLCLASSGGQQSVVFSLLGANVTVVDLTEGQLEGDRTAAEHYGYEVTTIKADMRDLSFLEKDSFDLVYQPPSMAYIPDVRQAYAQVARVLRPGGLYRADAQNPAAQFIDMESWDGDGYRIEIPFIKTQLDNVKEEAIESRHYLANIFNGLIELGFTIQQVQESPFHLRFDPQAEPGSWEHYLSFVPWALPLLPGRNCDL